ncbi:LOW QUALITY PROTEIN: hypothetical protein MXB_811 [Myxobolus squamalis]|nr:LOW QUALITY PROTEIN: hypothetical protein MXB_811 [Myxobolus squamalis]
MAWNKMCRRTAANNEICGVGVAFNSRIGGVRMLDGHVTDKVEAASLSLNPHSSWGPNDDGKTVEGPGTLARAALINGIKKGRNGLGSIYVWASGNGGHHSDDCNCDGYANSIYTLSISSASDQGDVPWYSETCASTFASTLSSGTHLQRRIITTDLHNKCTNNHTGTSASAPIAAGVFALLLESNQNLTWRDVQHLTVYTSNSMSLINAGNWSKNSVGLNFHSKFGYGILDTSKLIEWATEKDWETSPPMFSCYIPSQDEPILLSPQGEISVNFFIDECEDGKNTVNFIEHTQIQINIDHSHRGDLSIEVFSPSGTHSLLLHPRDEDDSTVGFSNWTMTSVHFWGENPRGLWRVKFKDNGGIFSKNIGIIKFCYLIIHGTETMTFYERFYIKKLKNMKREAIRKNNNNEKYSSFIPKAVVPLIYNQNEFMKNYLNYLSLIHYQNYIDNYAKLMNLFESRKLEYNPTYIQPFSYN